jgi:tetratricopeptide (TPR) repeat protein
VADTVNRTLAAHGVEAAITAYRQLRESQPAAFDFHPYQLDLLGHQLAERGALAEAIAIFKLNAEQFPDTPGVLESLAECQAQANDGAGALATYRRAQTRFPNSTDAREMVRRLEQVNRPGRA